MLELSWLSEYRGLLMGFAILIIVIYHFCNKGGTTLIDKGIRALFSQGYVGVDIFMVVSGLGLTYSCLKRFNLKEYYIKRWVRIFPFFTFITKIKFGKVIIWPLGMMGLFTMELYRISSSFERLLTNEACPEYHYQYVLL